MALLTRPRFRVISRIKWEVNITRKYRVASSAMLLKIVGILVPCPSAFTAKKTITENARKSDSNILCAGSVPSDLG